MQPPPPPPPSLLRSVAGAAAESAATEGEAVAPAPADALARTVRLPAASQAAEQPMAPDSDATGACESQSSNICNLVWALIWPTESACGMATAYQSLTLASSDSAACGGNLRATALPTMCQIGRPSTAKHPALRWSSTLSRCAVLCSGPAERCGSPSPRHAWPKQPRSLTT